MLPGGRRLIVAIAVDDEVELIRGMVDLLAPVMDHLVLAEGTTTFQGDARTVIGQGWRDILGLPAGQLTLITAELPPRERAATARAREQLQRAALRLGLRGEPRDALLVLPDADEYLSPTWLREYGPQVDSVRRLAQVPLFGGLDRRAPDWHCCRALLHAPIGVPRPGPAKWLCPGPLAGPLGELAKFTASRSAIRMAPGQPPAGWHLLHILPASGDPSRKLGRQAHDWDVSSEALKDSLAAGVHPNGWWLTTDIEPPAELTFLAQRHPGLLLGPAPADRQQMAEQALADYLLAQPAQEHPGLPKPPSTDPSSHWGA